MGAMTEEERIYENEDKHCKDGAPSSGLSGAQTPSDSTRKGINPDSNQALSLYTMKIWPGIPLSAAIEMRGLHLHILLRSVWHHLHRVYRSSGLKRKKKKNLSPILIGSRGSLVEGQIELERRMDDTHFEQQPNSQSSVTLA